MYSEGSNTEVCSHDSWLAKPVCSIPSVQYACILAEAVPIENLHFINEGERQGLILYLFWEIGK